MATLSPIRIVVTGSTSDASRSIRDLESSLDVTERRLGSFGSALTSLGKVTVLGSLATGAVQLAAALAPAIGILAVLPAVAAAAAAAIGTLFVGLSGISNAFKTSSATAGGAKTDLTSYQRAVENAGRAVVSAQKDVVDADRNVTKAERDVSDAQRSALEAQQALTDARKTASDALAAYADKLVDANLAEQDANLSLIDAQNNLAATQASGTADALTLQKAQLAVAEAQQRAKEAAEANAQTQSDAATAQAKGVDGASNVVDAQKNLDKANRDVQDSIQGVADAQDKVVEAQQKVVVANEQLADAQHALATAMDGGSGAINKQAAAMAALSPNARAFVQTVLSLKTQWDSLKNSVQDALLAGLDQQVRNLATVSFPILRTGMTSVATGFNEIATQASLAMQTPAFQGAMTATFNSLRTIFDQLAPAIQPFIVGLAQLVQVGLPFFNRFAIWVAGGLQLAGSFLSSSEGATKMTGVLDKATAVLQQVWAIGKNVATVIKNIFQGADAGNLLGTLERVTGALAKFTSSTQGKQDITSLFTALGQVAGQTAGVLPKLVNAVVVLANGFNSLPGPVKNAAGEFAAWSIVLGPVVSGAAKISAGIKGVIDIGQGIYKVTAAIVEFGAKYAAMTLEFIANAARTVASMAVTVASTVAGWVLMGVQALASAARMAAAWLIALGPIGIVIAAVIAIVALIVANWGTISKVTEQLWSDVKQWTSDAWNWLKGAVGDALDFVKNLFLNWTGPGLILNHWTTIKNDANSAWEWLKGVVGGALDFVKNIFLNWTGPGLIIKHWGDIKDAAGAAWDWIKGHIQDFLNWVGGIGDKISNALSTVWDGFKNGAKAAFNSVAGFWNNTVGKLNFTIPSWVPGIGGKNIAAPQIPMLAKGGLASGWTVVGEKGPELINVGSTSRVLSHSDSMAAAGNHVEYHPTYQFNAPIYGVDDLQKVLDEHDKKFIQLLEAM